MEKSELKRTTLTTAQSTIGPHVAIFWFRRDLRLTDNTGLYHALTGELPVLSVFIFDTKILDQLDTDHDRRVDFIHSEVTNLNRELQSIGSTLLVLYGDPCEIFAKLNPGAVYTNRDYEGYAIERDRTVGSQFRNKNIAFHSFKDHVIFEKDEVVKENGEPYTVFTPYSRKWRATLKSDHIAGYATEDHFNNFFRIEPVNVPSLKSMGFKSTGFSIPGRDLNRKLIEQYSTSRDYPALSGTSRLSVHLRFGTISIRSVVAAALESSEVWLNELIWRDFYAMILANFPYVEKRSFKPAYDHIDWRNNEEEFHRWCTGMTGYPIVDAGMRELNSTGFMHNRVRMVTASFLTKHLLIDWRWGEAYFAKQLLDYDLASNNGGWQWAAGSGCDASPYFRVFNPALQTEKFDKKHEYIKRWVPEYNDPARYPPPVVEHTFARQRAISTYRRALEKSETT